MIIDFQKDVVARSHDIPVLVDFRAEWCGNGLPRRTVVALSACPANTTRADGCSG